MTKYLKMRYFGQKIVSVRSCPNGIGLSMIPAQGR